MNPLSLRFAIALACPVLALFAPLLGQAGFSPFGQTIFFSFCIAVGSVVTAKSKCNRSVCQARTTSGLPCKHRAIAGEKVCVQHLQGFRAKLRAIPRSQTKAFWVNLSGNAISVVLTISFYVAGLPSKAAATAPSAPTGLHAEVQ